MSHTTVSDASDFHDEFDPDEADNPGTSASRRKWWIVGIIGVAIMSLFAGWFAISASGGVSYQQAGFKIISDSEVKVIWDVHTPEKKPTTCTLITLNDKRDVLGTKVVQLPASKYDSTRYEQIVKTTSRAVTGTVKECHYTGDRVPNQ